MALRYITFGISCTDIKMVNNLCCGKVVTVEVM